MQLSEAEISETTFIMPFSSDDVRSQRTYIHSRRLRRDCDSGVLSQSSSGDDLASQSQTSFTLEDLGSPTRSFSERRGSKLRRLAGRFRDWVAGGFRSAKVHGESRPRTSEWPTS